MLHESEWLTRKKRIDSRLKALGWTIRPFSKKLHLDTLTATAVKELPTRNGPADYGLFVGGKLLGIIEAKKITVNSQNVLEQAKRVSRTLSDFLTPDAMSGLFAQDLHTAADWLKKTPPVPR